MATVSSSVARPFRPRLHWPEGLRTVVTLGSLLRITALAVSPYLLGYYASLSYRCVVLHHYLPTVTAGSLSYNTRLSRDISLAGPSELFPNCPEQPTPPGQSRETRVRSYPPWSQLIFRGQSLRSTVSTRTRSSIHDLAFSATTILVNYICPSVACSLWREDSYPLKSI